MGSAAQQPTQDQQPQPSQPAPIAMPYIPTPEEQGYLAECAKAIVAGADAAVSAAATGNGPEFAQFATGVKALTDAYEAIKSGHAPSRHQGG